MAASDNALALLRESRDGGRIFHDNGATVTAAARAAGVRVRWVHVDLTALTAEYREFDGAAGADSGNVPVDACASLRHGGAGRETGKQGIVEEGAA